METFTEDLGDKNFIRAIIYTERENQKAILIGKGGSAIGKLRKNAEDRICQFLQKKYRLELRVEVAPAWRSNVKQLKKFGYID